MNNKIKSVSSEELEDFDSSIQDALSGLPDESAPMVDPRQRYAEVAAFSKEAKARIDKAAEAAAQAELERICSENPNMGAFTVRVDNKVYPKFQDGFSRVVPAIADRLTWNGWADKTQKEILENVQQALSLSGTISKGVWQYQLSSPLMRRIKHKLSNSSLPTVNLHGCKTLSDVKRAIQAADKQANASQNYKATVSISPDAVVINGTTYPIQMRPVGDYEYPSIRPTVDGKRAWVRVAHLIALLNGE